ncbi:hypothetical protein QOZ80_6AG0511510 [Eleusine coracana subsp. coracana]|nr:hypothetical protein QOZ80_6AG0511510 [Eleusine coracana subsp. coracana]
MDSSFSSNVEDVEVEAELIDLGVASELDPVTYCVFFSDNDVVGAKSWPAAEAIPSTLTNRNLLVNLCATYNVPNFYKPVLASDLGLAPNSWSYMAAFVLLCQDAGVVPLVSVFRYFFSICAHKEKGGGPSGWHHFQPSRSSGHRLFTGTLRNRVGWRSKYFLLESSTPWKCPVNWGKPRRADVHSQDGTNVTIEILSEKAGGNFNNFLSRRSLPIGSYIDPEQLQASVKVKARAASTGKRKAPGVLWPFRRRSGRKQAASRCQCRRGRASIGSRSQSRPALRSLNSKEHLSVYQPGSRNWRSKEEEHAADLAKLQQEHTVCLAKLQERLVEQHAAEMARVKDAAAKEVKQLEEQLSGKAKEHEAGLARLQVEHAAAMGRVKDAAAKEVQSAEARAKKNVMLALFPDGKIDSSLLEP